MNVLNYNIKKSLDRQKFWEARRFFLEYGVFKSSEHGFRCGSVDEYYFDIDHLLNDPHQCSEILGIYADLISEIQNRNRLDFLAFVEKASGGTVGAIRLAGALSMRTNLTNIVVRPKKAISFDKVKVRLPRNKVGVNSVLDGLKGAVVTDHCTTGTEALFVVDLLRGLKATIGNVVSYTIRTDLFVESKYQKKDVEINYAYGLPKFKEIPKSTDDLGKIAINY